MWNTTIKTGHDSMGAMAETRSKIQMRSRGTSSFIYNALVMLTLQCGLLSEVPQTSAQSIGYHPQFNFGFNPYMSPVFGYGLGLPFGANNMSPTKNPWLMMSSFSPAPYADKHGFISKLHAKAFLKKLASSQALSSTYYGLKDKVNLIKHPQFAFTPYAAGYGYGKHYGAAVVPNNPYKSTYGDFYDQTDAALSRPVGALESLKHESQIPIGGRPPLADSSFNSANPIAPVHVAKSHGLYLKPLIKAGALLTTAALLGKKVLESPIRLNPSGMILNDLRP